MLAEFVSLHSHDFVDHDLRWFSQPVCSDGSKWTDQRASTRVLE